MKNASQGNETQGLTFDKITQGDEENVFRWNILLRIGVAILYGIGRVAGGLRIVLTLAPLIGVWLIRNKHHKKDPLEMIKEYKKHKLRIFFSILAGIAFLYAVGYEFVKPFSPLPQIEIVGISSGEDKKDIGTSTGYVLELQFKNTETISLNGSGYELINDSLTKKYNLSFMTGATFTISATNFFNKSVERKLKVTRSLSESELAQIAEKERVATEKKEQDAKEYAEQKKKWAQIEQDLKEGHEKMKAKYEPIAKNGYMYEVEQKLHSMGFKVFDSGFSSAPDNSTQPYSIFMKVDDKYMVYIKLQGSYALGKHYYWVTIDEPPSN